MNLEQFSHRLSRTEIAAMVAALLGVVVTVYAAAHIMERIWAHATLALIQVPGLGAGVVLAAGVVLLLAAPALLRRGVRRAHPDLDS
ncbi:hypothetical protein ACIP98_18600 [Streptomyces sp. NPDC088354]|uniref:hypothetical protein n=1 Tax=unclassified Streptomyces TaxID=2593676 RepID=UPI0029A86F36|nr:hypothetical protein [Streptomyces sp. MI02-7b]MDX3072682.1 hypothetical protein [Streptomyces sp. MI02-7b]